MSGALLSWGAQIAAHAAYVEAHQIARAAEPAPRASVHRAALRTTESAKRNRQALLHALRDRQPHPFRDLRAALPGLSCQGIYYLVEALGADGLITVDESRRNRTYQLT